MQRRKGERGRYEILVYSSLFYSIQGYLPSSAARPQSRLTSVGVGLLLKSTSQLIPYLVSPAAQYPLHE